MRTIAYSPVRPEFIELQRLMWAANATRYATTTRRDGRAHAADQGKGHRADMQRLSDALAKLTPSTLADFMAWNVSTR